jgi:hypothetical protein
MVTSNRTIKWIESLAEQELSIRSGERASIDLLATKDEVLSVETTSFLRELNQQFDYLVRLFDLRVNQDALKIKILKNEDILEGFTLLRNELRLLVTKPRLGVVQITCDKRLTGDSRPSVMFSGVVEAKFGIFHDVEWLFLGSQVTAEQVARHYLTEFIQVSRSSH